LRVGNSFVVRHGRERERERERESPLAPKRRLAQHYFVSKRGPRKKRENRALSWNSLGTNYSYEGEELLRTRKRTREKHSFGSIFHFPFSGSFLKKLLSTFFLILFSFSFFFPFPTNAHTLNLFGIGSID